MTVRADFGNWIRLRIVLTFLMAGAALALVGLLLADPLLRAGAWAVAVFPLGMGAFLAYLFIAFSERGGRVQRRLWELVLGRLDWDGAGEALDVGTGQGALAVGLAARATGARVTGVDLWAADWEYSQAACERNARAMGVGDRVRFERASAAALPFADASMDAVVSHFVFHEVRDGGGPLGGLAEAARVLKPGGALAVQDMFLDPRIYGAREALIASLRGMGLTDVKLTPLRELMPIPWGMGGRRVLGAAALVTARRG